MRQLIINLLLIPQLTFALSCGSDHSIIQKPIIFDNTRIAYTRDYQRIHYGIESNSIEIDPKIIVLHWTESPQFSEAFNFFNSAEINWRPELPDRLNVSAHFLVDRDGTIYQLMPDHWMAKHVIGLNHVAIGIENIGGVDNHPDLTEAQAQSNAYLVCYLKQKYPGIEYLIGHMDYLNFKNTSLWLEKDPRYQNKEKQDPGIAFMQRVRELIGNIGLKGSPSCQSKIKT